ncbi:MAG: hypothetical protein U5L45_04940 [Saprospiraceae bacterium]|nr:hypothetical protein [Saprospiraceae bacterium]
MQKTLLDYAHPQLLSHALALLAKKGEVVRFSGKARKTNHIPFFLRAKRAMG